MKVSAVNLALVYSNIAFSTAREGRNLDLVLLGLFHTIARDEWWYDIDPKLSDTAASREARKCEVRR